MAAVQLKMTDLDQTEKKYQHLKAKSFRKQPQFKLDGLVINKQRYHSAVDVMLL